MSDAPLLVETVSDTALIVAYARAVETERTDAVFRDPLARSLAGERGKKMYDKIQGDYSLGWLVSTRTWILDSLIQQAIQNGVDTVLNLAAGLDTRPYRMELPPDLRWIEVDLSGILAYKQEKLACDTPVCRLERIPLDLTLGSQRQQVLAAATATAHRVLAITEGLLVYLPPRQVEAIAIDLAQQPAVVSWLSDLVSPLAAKVAELRMSGERVAEQVQLQFAPANSNSFFQSCGWQVDFERSLWHEAHTIKRNLWLGHLVRWLPAFNLSIVQLSKMP
jgi:methyltransferase (TIGR00027 family)